MAVVKETSIQIRMSEDEKAILKENTPIGDILNMVWGATIAVARTCRSNSNKCRDGH